MMSYLYELNDNFVERFEGQKYWISDRTVPGLAHYSDSLIWIKESGAYYVKNRHDGSTGPVPLKDGSMDWLTVQILSSKRHPGHTMMDAGIYYAPYIPLQQVSVADASIGIEPLLDVQFKTRYGMADDNI